MSRRISRRAGDGTDWRWLVRVVVIGLVAFVIGYAVTWLLFLPGSNRPPVVTVPDLRALTPPAAERALARSGLELEIGDSLPNPEMPAGQVLSQSPLPGREVAPGSDVRVILSAGPPQRSVPVVSSLTRDQALQLLAAHGFQVEVQEVPDVRAQGRIVGVEPAPGTVVRLPASVRLLVSAGPPLVAVPGLVGLSPEQAQAALDAVGLRLGEVEHIFAGLEVEERVRSQDPQPGDSIRQGAAVRVWVASSRLPGITVPRDNAGRDTLHE